MAGAAVRESATFAGRADQVREARAFVGRLLGPSHPCGDVAVLLAREMMTNSLLHGGSAGLHARLVLLEWGLAALSESLELVVSELVTNGVRASRAMGQDAVRIWLGSDLGRVVVFVWDASPRPPAQAADPGADALSGRGLLLVEALSERWGHFGYDGDGKVVWALLEAASAAPGASAAGFIP
jgi:hypothetical protein